ncbi:TRAP transporter substrate-binding protein [Microvirga subterranea]|uniref:TRAP-type C4-dicarboxylate transport system substrate-binding protein n=1 Tax=Microvirga subterranea TaxID=186651 RepID=A0A370HHZ7_9HYPH|nr:TRAP transporter substrate-binding protein [Microvirga subterranea]RDI56795.1 TRAP-type C4-dicarboxylate transport system substrate-binding protein [Microvirga subterranea]
MQIRLSGYQGPASVHTRGLHDLARRLSSEGWETQVQEDVTAAGQAAKALFSGVESEDAQICYMASGYLTARVPSLAVLDLPLTVQDRLAAHQALDGEAGRILSHEIERMTGLHVLGFWDNGLRHISNRTRPIRSPEDCSGLVIRTLDNELYKRTLRAFGFRPVVTDVRELRQAVVNGTVDAQENPLTNMLNFGIHEHHRHLSLTGHIFGVALLVCRASWFRALPLDVSTALSQAAAAATRMQRQLALEEDRIVLSRLLEFGVEIVSPDDLQMADFRSMAAPVLAAAMAEIDQPLMRAYFGDRTFVPLN